MAGTEKKIGKKLGHFLKVKALSEKKRDFEDERGILDSGMHPYNWTGQSKVARQGG